MTVKELIDTLNAIKDKDSEILIDDVYEGRSPIESISRTAGYLHDQDLVEYYIIYHS